MSTEIVPPEPMLFPLPAEWQSKRHTPSLITASEKDEALPPTLLKSVPSDFFCGEVIGEVRMYYIFSFLPRSPVLEGMKDEGSTPFFASFELFFQRGLNSLGEGPVQVSTVSPLPLSGEKHERLLKDVSLLF